MKSRAVFPEPPSEVAGRVGKNKIICFINYIYQCSMNQLMKYIRSFVFTHLPAPFPRIKNLEELGKKDIF